MPLLKALLEVVEAAADDSILNLLRGTVKTVPLFLLTKYPDLLHTIEWNANDSG